MILRPTVFVVGAGGSAPYGYPLGQELVDRISSATLNDNHLTRLLGRSTTEELQHRLTHSHVASIDDFLAANEDLLDVGKAAIAATLTVFRPQARTWPSPGEDWYRYLWMHLHQGAATSSEFLRNRLSVVSYNYDTSLERYLERVLRSYYPDLASLPRKELRSWREGAVPVLHLHGSLAEVEDVLESTAEPSSLLTPDFVDAATAGIRVVHEEAMAAYETAHERLGEAERLHILGFGFHPTNVRRLNLAGIAKARRAPWSEFGGTAFGLEKAECARAEASIALEWSEYLATVDAITYLRRHALLQ